LLELFNLFSGNYLVLLHEDSFIKITSGSGNPFGIGSSNSGSSNSNPNPNQLSGNEPMFEVENFRKRKQEEIEKSINKLPEDKFSGKKALFSKKGFTLDECPDENPQDKYLGKTPLFTKDQFILDEHISKKLKGKQPVYNNQVEQSNLSDPSKGKMQIEPLKRPKSLFRDIVHRRHHVRVDGYFSKLVSSDRFVYYDPETKRTHNPEVLHAENTGNFFNNAIRCYNDSGIHYSYNCMSEDTSKHFCRVTYPDLSICDIYRTQTMQDNIEFHRKHVKLGYQMEPKFDYHNHYVKHFDFYRKQTIQNLLIEYQKVNSNRVIGLNTIPKDNNNPKLFDENSELKLIFENKNYLSQYKKNIKYLYVDGK
jgi:hypothetical protein